MSGIIYPDESYALMGACFHVYKAMGCGFLENVYHECLEIEFEEQGIPFESYKELKLTYRNKQLKQTYKPDLYVMIKLSLK